MENLDKLAAAFVALQADLVPVAKSKVNPFFKSNYAPLPEVMESIQPLLAKHKLAIAQFPTNLNGESALQTILIHESGQTLKGEPTPLLLAKQDAQSQGSAMTYARRYGVMAVLGLVADEDDDGNKASYSTPKTAPKPSEKQLGLIRTLAREQGLTDAEINQKLEKITTIEMANAAIKKLKGE